MHDSDALPIHRNHFYKVVNLLECLYKAKVKSNHVRTLTMKPHQPVIMEESCRGARKC